MSKKPSKQVKGARVLRVAIVDDAEDVRALWRTELERDPEFHVCAEGADGKDAIELARRLQPEVMLLDLAMPGVGGLEALPAILDASPATQVVVFSGFGRREFSRTAGALGACGFLDKRLQAGPLPQRLRRVLAGQAEPGVDEQPLVLVLATQPGDRELAERLLTWLGYRAEEAGTVAAALDQAADYRYVAALVADPVAEMSTADAVAALQARTTAGQALPVIVMSESSAAAATNGNLRPNVVIGLPLELAELDEALARHALRQAATDPAERGAAELDMTALLALTHRLGPDQVAAVLRGFQIQTTERLIQLQAAIATGDERELASVAHTIKGAAGSVGAAQVAAIAQELEVLARSGSLDGSRDRTRRLREAFDRTIETLAAQDLFTPRHDPPLG